MFGEIVVMLVAKTSKKDAQISAKADEQNFAEQNAEQNAIASAMEQKQAVSKENDQQMLLAKY